MSNIKQDTSEMGVIFVHSSIDDYPLTPFEFRIYAHLARRAGHGTAYPSIEGMAHACKMSPETVRKAVHALLAYSGPSGLVSLPSTPSPNAASG